MEFWFVTRLYLQFDIHCLCTNKSLLKLARRIKKSLMMIYLVTSLFQYLTYITVIRISMLHTYFEPSSVFLFKLKFNILSKLCTSCVQTVPWYCLSNHGIWEETCQGESNCHWWWSIWTVCALLLLFQHARYLYQLLNLKNTNLELALLPRSKCFIVTLNICSLRALPYFWMIMTICS